MKRTIKWWYNQIKDKTVRKKLFANAGKNHLKLKVDSMAAAIHAGFLWKLTIEEEIFWFEIWRHFVYGQGLKTYEDFKHLDMTEIANIQQYCKNQMPITSSFYKYSAK